MSVCSWCDGTGKRDLPGAGVWVACAVCKGTGETPAPSPSSSVNAGDRVALNQLLHAVDEAMHELHALGVLRSGIVPLDKIAQLGELAAKIRAAPYRGERLLPPTLDSRLLERELHAHNLARLAELDMLVQTGARERRVEGPPTKCEADACTCLATHAYVWPGRGRTLMCLIDTTRMLVVANALGLSLETLSVERLVFADLHPVSE